MKKLLDGTPLEDHDLELVLSGEVAEKKGYDEFLEYMESIDWESFRNNADITLHLVGEIKQDWLHSMLSNDWNQFTINISKLDNPEVLIEYSLPAWKKKFKDDTEVCFKIVAEECPDLPRLISKMKNVVETLTEQKQADIFVFPKLRLDNFLEEDDEVLSQIPGSIFECCECLNVDNPQQVIKTLAQTGINCFVISETYMSSSYYDVSELRFPDNVTAILSINVSFGNLLKLLKKNPQINRVAMYDDSAFHHCDDAAVRNVFLEKMAEGLEVQEVRPSPGEDLLKKGWMLQRKILNSPNTPQEQAVYIQALMRFSHELSQYSAAFNATPDTLSAFSFLTFSKVYKIATSYGAAVQTGITRIKRVLLQKDDTDQSLARRIMLQREPINGLSRMYYEYGENILPIEFLQLLRDCDYDSFKQFMCADPNNENRACKNAENLLFVVCVYLEKVSREERTVFIRALSRLSQHGALFQDGTEAIHFNAALGTVDAQDVGDLHRADNKGITAWHYAAAMGQLELFKQLPPRDLGQVVGLMGKDAINGCTFYASCTVLIIAVYCQQWEFIDYIFQNAEQIEYLNARTSLCAGENEQELTCLILLLDSEKYELARACWRKLTAEEQKAAEDMISDEEKYPDLMYRLELDVKTAIDDSMDETKQVLGKRKDLDPETTLDSGEQEASSASSPSFFPSPPPSPNPSDSPQNKRPKVATDSDNESDEDMPDVDPIHTGGPTHASS